MASKYPALQPVQSSMFSRAGYASDFWHLYYEFKSTGEIRRYKNIAPEVADIALTAESIGKWWNANVKGNSTWEYDVLEPENIPEPKEKQDKPLAKSLDEQCGLTDEELNMIAPDPNALPSEGVGIYDGPANSGAIAETYGGIKRGPSPEISSDPSPSSSGDITVETLQQHYIATLPPTGEILGAWTAPESAAEALDLLAERENEIKAIIKANTETGQQALTVKVTSQESRLEASETLTKLASKKELTTKALDPFRKVLYDAYTEAGAKVKAGVEPLDKAISHVKSQCLAWDQQIERQRQDALRKEREEREAEARRQQEEESRRLTLAEVDQRLEKGDEVGAQTLFDNPIEAPKPYIAPRQEVIPPPPPKVEGQSTATTWKVDRDAVESDPTGAAYLASITVLLRAVKDGSYPLEQAAPLLSWDFSKCDDRAKSLMSAFNVPGLSAGPKSTMRVGGRGKKGRG